MRELTLPAPLVLLPGLGADAEMFFPQREAFGDAVHVPDWIAPEDAGENFARYAERWAGPINEMIAGFDPGRPWFLGGASMGGMLAMELVPHLKRQPAAVLLIASARSTPDYPMFVKVGASLMSHLSPALVAKVIRLGAIPFGIRDGQDDTGYKLLLKMAKAADPLRLKWGVGAASEWTYAGPPETLDNGEAFPPIQQIHGQADWMIPVREADTDRVVERGRHLITISHANTVNRWLFEQITAYCGIDESNEPRVEDPGQAVRRRPEFAAIY